MVQKLKSAKKKQTSTGEKINMICVADLRLQCNGFT